MFFRSKAPNMQQIAVTNMRKLVDFFFNGTKWVLTLAPAIVLQT